uniref:tRNA synthetases class I catalytic domain-containing protein n=1 Tax=Megaselia scalaris TaxID=36166 RepID=T1GPJ0_MEGSC
MSSWEKPQGIPIGIEVFNCIEKKQVPLILRKEHKFATWYTCGPTVYDSSHIGHASCYMKLDIIQRILTDYFKVDLVTAMNITDIDDKIIKKGQESGTTWTEKLNIRKPDIKIRVTEHIPKIINFIEKLVQDGFAYVGSDKSVYFKVSSYPNYGKLQKVVLDDKNVEHKSSSADFALWKAKKQPDEPFWNSPWGEGRP